MKFIAQVLTRKFPILFVLLIVLSSFPLLAQKKPDPRSYRERAEEAIKSKNIKAAAALLEDWIKVNPRDGESAVVLARCFMQLSQPERAFETLKTAAELGCANSKVLTNDSIFTPLRFTRRYDELVQAFKWNADQVAEFPIKFAPQHRYGRYRVLYPLDYDEVKKYNLVLLLHGNSQDPNIILRWAKKLNLNDVIFVCPEAPYIKFRESAMTFAPRLSAMGEDLGYPDTLKDEIIFTSADWYHSIIKEVENELPIKKALPIIMGFSQGGFYANVIATRHPESVKSVITICASMYPEAKVLEHYSLLRKYGIDVLLLHASDDPLVPYQTASLYKNALELEKVEHTFFSFKGGHWPSTEASLKITDWISKHFQE